MRTSDFDYDLPRGLIAQTPMEPRDHSRLMVVSRDDGSIRHRHFFDLPEYLREGDLLVFNDSRVFPARLNATRTDTGGAVEVLLLHRVSPGMWRTLVRPGRRMREGAAFEVAAGGYTITGQVVQVEADGDRIVTLSGEEHLERLGVVPLPPYIHRPLEDAERYQTVYARVEGSVAAPTAGLHFTPGLLDRIRDAGVELAFVTLHIGWASFRPAKTEDVSAHRLQSERWELDREAACAVNRAKREGRRVVSIGTTAVRLLEHAAAIDPDDADSPGGPGNTVARRLGVGRPVHLPRLPVSHRGRPGNQLPPAKVDPADAHERLRGPGPGARRIPGGRGQRLPVRQLRGRDAGVVKLAGCPSDLDPLPLLVRPIPVTELTLLLHEVMMFTHWVNDGSMLSHRGPSAVL